MKMNKLALIALLGGALMAFGCSSDDNGGTGGTGGTGGAGGGAAACLPQTASCENGTIDPITACCDDLAAPPTADSACTGDESLENPTECATTGTVVTHQLTALAVAEDCNTGYDLDGCDGQSCINGGLAPADGTNGVDNALTGLSPVLAGVGGNLDGVNQAFSDVLCGVTSSDDEAPETTCDTTIDALDLSFAVDANLDDNCATVGLLVGGELAGTVFLNVSAPDSNGNVCASGMLGSIPLEIAGTMGTLDNATLRMTITGGLAPVVGDDGFTNGVLGATINQATASAIADALIDGGSAVVSQVLDINTDLSGDNDNACDALSATLIAGGVVTDISGGGGAGGNGGNGGNGG